VRACPFVPATWAAAVQAASCLCLAVQGLWAARC